MEIVINENIRIWTEYNPFELPLNDSIFSVYDSKRNAVRLGFSKERIAIKGVWFDVLTPSDLVRKRNITDGYYRVVYIQINTENGEYYIGKANRPTWSGLQKYQGSGLKFANKFNKYKSQFTRYYIAACKTAEETEQLEASIVDKNLLSDEKCLNLVAGGGGVSKRQSIAESSESKREYMRRHPEQFAPMLEASKKAFQSGDTASLRSRNMRIKETMGAEKYREMSRIRITNWKNENPIEYANARTKNHEAIKTSEAQEKRKKSLKRWAENNPEKHSAWQEKLLKSRTSEEANGKRKKSLNEWADSNPEQAKENAQKRANAAAEKLSKEVFMIDLQTGRVLKSFPSQRAAAKWLVDNGKAKNTNCASSISAVCSRKLCSTGYGYRKKAFGYDWRFRTEIEA